MSGSPDIYEQEEREPEQSVNFVTCHDGFTLNDVVSFNSKHNELNGEANRDGSNDNLSWNCGREGDTTDPEVERLRQRQIKNFLTLTLLAIGTPMLLMGDEVRRSQGGNNNAYCQDNEASWFDWALLETNAEIHRFTKALIALRLNRNLPTDRHDMTLRELLHRQPVEWHGVKPNEPDWSHASHAFAGSVRLVGYPLTLYVIVNAYWGPLEFELPPPDRGSAVWKRAIDTSLQPPDDVSEWMSAKEITHAYLANPRSIVVLLTSSHPPSRPLQNEVAQRSASG